MGIIYKPLFIFISIFLLSFSCEEEVIGPEIDHIAYGVSFGECLGYCERTIIIDESKIVFTKIGYDTSGRLPDSTEVCYKANPLAEYCLMLDTAAFFKLNDVVGCPDCADGGAEWLEVGSTANFPYKRVTFEYMNEPEGLSDIISRLRKEMDSF